METIDELVKPVELKYSAKLEESTDLKYSAKTEDMLKYSGLQLLDTKPFLGPTSIIYWK
jgi:hypothetical protein